MSQPTVLDTYVDIFRLLSDAELKDGYFFGKIKLNEKIVADLKVLEQTNHSTGSCEIFKNNSKISDKNFDVLSEQFFEDDITTRIDLLASNFSEEYIICDNWNTLLAYEKNIKKCVQNIFFTDYKIYLRSDSSDSRYKNYLKLHKVYDLVKQLMHEPDTDSNTIYYERPVRLGFTLPETALDSAIEIDALNNLLDKDLHKEAIKCLISKEIVLLLKDIDLKKRFEHLILNLNPLVSNVLLSYQSYVENYSFDKVRREYQEKKTEYVKKINDVFDTTATKLLSVPAGLWFATSNIKPAEFGNIDYIKNVIILISSVILTVLLVLNIHGQFSILNSLKKEYTNVFERLKSKFENEESEIGDLQRDLNSKDFQVSVKLWIAIISTFLLFAFTLWIFVYSS